MELWDPWEPCQSDIEQSQTNLIAEQREWLQEWNNCTKPDKWNSTPLPESATRISTPLKLPAWAEALKNYPNEEVALFFLRGIAHGFKIGFIPGSTSLQSAKQNLEGALLHPQVVEEYLKVEVGLGRVAGLNFFYCNKPQHQHNVQI